MSNKLYLNDRVELHSVFADTSNMSTANFYSNNNALACTISKVDINPPLLDVTNNPIYIVGVNQQSGKECKVEWINFASTTEFSITNTSTYSDWNEGYYRIFIRQYKAATNGTDTKVIDSGMYHDLNKKPIYWNKSPLQFMTYINSGSFEIGCPRNEVGNENSNVTVRKLITISKPFYIQRTHITCNLFNKVFQAVDSTAYGKYGWTDKDKFTNLAKAYLCNRRYYSTGEYGCMYGGSTSIRRVYPSPSNFSNVIGLTYTASYTQGGYTSPTTILSAESLNEVPVYMLNSTGYTSSAKDVAVYATRSFCEYFMQIGVNPDNTSSPLANGGWKWYLPTEAQWEYACRAGTTTGLNNGVNLENPYPSSATSADGNILEQNVNEVAVWYKHIATNTSSALLKPNKYGLYDTHGLLFEWIVDAQSMNYNNISGDNYTTDGANGTFAGSPVHQYVTDAALRGLRGGSYGNYYYLYGRALRSAYRYWLNPPLCGLNYGARLVLVQP